MLRLYQFERCPYCEKVRFALDHLGLEWEEAKIDPRDRSEVMRVSGQPLVPVLDDDGTVVADSTRILSHVAEKHDMSLLPPTDHEQGLAAMAEDWADEILSVVVKAWLKTPTDPAREALDVALGTLDALLHDHSYVVGESLTYADISVYSFLVSLPEEARQTFFDPYVNLKDWFMNLCDYREKSRGSRGGGYTEADFG